MWDVHIEVSGLEGVEWDIGVEAFQVHTKCALGGGRKAVHHVALGQGEKIFTHYPHLAVLKPNSHLIVSMTSFTSGVMSIPGGIRGRLPCSSLSRNSTRVAYGRGEVSAGCA